MELLENIPFLLMIILFVVFGIKQLKASMLCTHRIIGKIESIRVSHSDDSTNYLAKCSYMYRGRPYVSEEVDVEARNRVGDQIDIYINPYKPRMAVKSRGMSFLTGVICLVVGFLVSCYFFPQFFGLIGESQKERYEDKYEAIRNEATQKEIVRRREERLSQQKNQSDVHILLSGKKRVYEKDEYASLYIFNELQLRCPAYVSNEVYDQGTVNSHKATLYHKGTGNIYMRVYNIYNKNRIEYGMLYLRKWIAKNAKGAKLVKRVKTRKETVEIYSVLISNTNGKKRYRHYAIYSEKREMYILVFEGDLKELINIVKDIY